MRTNLSLLLLLCTALPLRADEWRTQLESRPVQTAALALARHTMQSFLKTGQVPKVPAGLPPALKRRGAVFVTVEKRGQVTPRGCRGTLQPISSTLAEEIIRNTVAACSRDKRVAPLRFSEMPQCLVSLTVVLKVQPLSSLSAHDPQNNGLVARSGSKVGIVLPYEGRESITQAKWAKRKAGLNENSAAELLELVAVRFREADEK